MSKDKNKIIFRKEKLSDAELAHYKNFSGLLNAHQRQKRKQFWVTITTVAASFALIALVASGIMLGVQKKEVQPTAAQALPFPTVLVGQQDWDKAIATSTDIAQTAWQSYPKKSKQQNALRTTVLEQDAEPKGGLDNLQKDLLQQEWHCAHSDKVYFLSFVIDEHGELSQLEASQQQCTERMKQFLEAYEWQPAQMQGMKLKQRIILTI